MKKRGGKMRIEIPVFSLDWNTELSVLKYLEQKGYSAYVDGDRYTVTVCLVCERR